ncbi:hypothetical protein F5148DRAFT_1279348 [Russula earlei]|uniref:Uncharacterized protein n=1 Tax=Russula earlei TaxID=71964 RepID=A0ACC0UMM9_9AGAM|nr:hypothetical protein F5148DRAFT_1279348 [Russula earlei]
MTSRTYTKLQEDISNFTDPYNNAYVMMTMCMIAVTMIAAVSMSNETMTGRIMVTDVIEGFQILIHSQIPLAMAAKHMKQLDILNPLQEQSKFPIPSLPKQMKTESLES